ncbi:expressed unknown protein [Seminavis robusta]|uniref:SAM domain-containing protein n=1 Tax=Seminavis robusta TaxID=568900 RepID=A0A9N8HFA5_9STRA|nr:expressed unknown protein [Seminavis robusta]|eukprot:Sro341_g121330.1 n/a (333) ;mRNA; f:6067-7065
MTQIEKFNISEVSSWLIQNGFGSHVDVFRSCEVDGAFLVEMTPEDLIDDLALTPMDATNLLNAIQREKAGCVPTATAYAVNAYVPSAAATGSSYSPAPSYSPTPNRSYSPSPAANTPSSFSPPDPRIQMLETENYSLKQHNAALEADNMRLQGELQNLKTMYDQLVQQQQQQQQQQAIVPAQAQPAYVQPPAYTPTPPPQPTYTPTPPPQPTYAPAQPTYTPTPPPQQTYPTQTYYQPVPQQQQVDYSQQQAPQQAYATQPATTTAADPSKSDGMKKTGFNVVKGAGVGALGGATMGAIAGAILPNMDAGDGAKAGAAMGALGGGVSGFMKK